MKTKATERRSGGIPATAIVTGLWIGSLDLATSVALHGTQGARPSHACAGMAATSAGAIVLFGLAWCCLVSPVARKAHWDATAAAVGFGYALVAGFVAAFLGVFSFLGDSIAGLLATACLVLAGAFGIGAAAYHLSRVLRQRPRAPRIVLTAHATAPPFLAAAALFTWGPERWVLDPPGPSGLLFPGMIGILALIACVAAVALLRDRVGWLIRVVTPVMVLLPWTPLWIASRPGPPPMPAATEGAARHVILIVVDTLRADMLSCCGAKRFKTPHIDALADDGILFENAMAPASWTLPSMASVLTGLSPLVHRANHRYDTLPRECTTLPEFLGPAGYETAAIGKNFMLGEHRGVNQGFRQFQWYPKPVLRKSLGASVLATCFDRHFGTDPSTKRLVDFAIDWTDDHSDDPFFLWLHIYDPHLPYSPPRAYLPKNVAASPAIGNALLAGQSVEIRRGGFAPNSEERLWIQRLYEGEVRYVDDQVGRFIAHLKDSGLYDDSFVILVSDHGEEFWEHGGFEHGHTLYQEVLRVPMIVKLPGNAPSGRRTARVSIENIMPTVLDVCAVPHDGNGLNGESLRKHWTEGWERIEDETVYATGMLYFEEQEMLVAGNRKLIRRRQGVETELYDLAQDPEEAHPAARNDAVALDEMLVLLQDRYDRANVLRARNGLGAPSPGIPASPDIKEMLRSIGYI